jgi:hypothetical protein
MKGGENVEGGESMESGESIEGGESIPSSFLSEVKGNAASFSFLHGCSQAKSVPTLVDRLLE